MRAPERTLTTLVLATVLSWLANAPVAAQAEDPYAYDEAYVAGDFGRVTYQENGLSIHRAFADPGLPPVAEAGVNAPVYPGDKVLTDERQRAEVQLAGGSLVRIDRATDVTFLGLPDPYAEFADHTVLQLTEGSLRVAALLADGEEFRVDTPSASVYLLGSGDYRVEVTPGGRTEVVSRGGVAEVVGNGGSVLVQGGMRTEVFPASLPEEAWAFNTFVTDAFDRWVDERDAVYRVRDRYPEGGTEYAEAYESVPAEVRPYYPELARHGEWAFVEPYGYVWYPSAVPVGWRPYYDGYWDYGPGGYFWVSYEPWGWAPYHYGRWNWVVGFGWCWVPGRVFSGAWVAWSWGPSYVGWAPVDYWGRPCYVRHVYYGYYDPYAWTFVGYAHVGHRGYHRYAVRVEDVGEDLRRATVVTRAPRIAPTRLASSRDARARAVRLAEGDGAGRMRPVDRDRRPALALDEVERTMRGRDRAVGRDVRAPSSIERTGAVDRRAPDRRAAQRREDDPTSANGARRVSDRATSSPVRPRDDERAGTERVRGLYRRMATPRSTGDSGPAAERRTTAPARPPQRSVGRRETSAPRERATPPSRTRTEPRSREERRTSPPPSRATDREQRDRGPSPEGPAARERRRPTSSGPTAGRSSPAKPPATRRQPSPGKPPATRRQPSPAKPSTQGRNQDSGQKTKARGKKR